MARETAWKRAQREAGAGEKGAGKGGAEWEEWHVSEAPLRSLLSPDSSLSLASPALLPAPPPPPPPQTKLMTHSSPGPLLAASFCGRRNSSAAFPSPTPPPPTSLPGEEGFSEDCAGQRSKQRWRFHTLEGGAEPCPRFPVGSWGLSHRNAAIFLITPIFQTGRTGSAHLSRAPGSTPSPGTISVYSVDVLGWRDLPGDTADGKTEEAGSPGQGCVADCLGSSPSFGTGWQVGHPL